MATQTFGTKLSTLMEEAGLNQTQLADKVGIDRTVISRIVNDKRHPQNHEIGWFAEAFGVPIEELLDGVELPEPIRREIERVQDLARKVLDAEQERDDALAQLEAMKSAHQAELDARERILETVRNEGRAAVDVASQKLIDCERGWRQHVDQVNSDRDALAREVAQLKSVVAVRDGQLAAKDKQITKLKGQLTTVRQGANSAAVVVGLLGLAGGAALGSMDR